MQAYPVLSRVKRAATAAAAVAALAAPRRWPELPSLLSSRLLAMRDGLTITEPVPYRPGKLCAERWIVLCGCIPTAVAVELKGKIIVATEASGCLLQFKLPPCLLVNRDEIDGRAVELRME